MFGLGIGEVLLILIVALIVFGPTRLPDLARTMGKAMAEFRKASRDLRDTFEYEVHRMDEPGRPKLESKAQRPIDAEFEEAPRPAAPEGTAPAAGGTASPPAAPPSASGPASPAGSPPVDGHG